MGLLDESLIGWIKERAESLDTRPEEGDAVVARLAVTSVFRVGVPETEGGTGGKAGAAIGVVAELAQYSLSAAFVFWAQRALIECVRTSPNQELVRRLLPDLMYGQLAGAPGLSNAMKFLGGLDQLRTRRVPGPDGTLLNGTVPWATNLHRQGFVAAIAAGDADGANPAVIAVPDHASGVVRSADFNLVALRGTNTAALHLQDVVLDDSWLIHPDARTFLPAIRPMFIGLQCGLGLGLARASLRSAQHALGGSRSVLAKELAALEAELQDYWDALSAGIDEGRWRERPRELLALRMRMVALASHAVELELQALGGRALLRSTDEGFNRRRREAAFLQVVTPTMAQLKNELAAQG